MWAWAVAAVAGLVALGTAYQRKGDDKPKGKTYEDGLSDGEKAANTKAKQKAAEKKSLEKIIRKQVAWEQASRSRYRRRLDDADDDDDDDLAGSTTPSGDSKGEQK